jgi:ABC-type microcin C transport system permease subunit YejE
VAISTSPADYLDPFIRDQFGKDGNWAIYPLNHYNFDTLNYFAEVAESGTAVRRELAGHRRSGDVMWWLDCFTDSASRCCSDWR